MVEHNLELVRSAYDAFSRGDLATVRAMYTDATVWRTPGFGPFDAEYKGADEVIRYLTELFERSEGTFKVVPEFMYGDDERVVVLERYTMSRLGRHAELDDVIVYEISDGKFTVITQYEVDIKALEEFWA